MEDDNQKRRASSQAIQNFEMLFPAACPVGADCGVGFSNSRSVHYSGISMIMSWQTFPRDAEIRSGAWKTSTHLKTTCERSTIRRRSDKDVIITRCKVPCVPRFVKRLQYSWVDCNRYNLRLARRKCDSLPPHQALEGLVSPFGKRCIHFRDLCASPSAGVLDGETHGLRG